MALNVLSYICNSVEVAPRIPCDSTSGVLVKPHLLQGEGGSACLSGKLWVLSWAEIEQSEQIHTIVGS